MSAYDEQLDKILYDAVTDHIDFSDVESRQAWAEDKDEAKHQLSALVDAEVRAARIAGATEKLDQIMIDGNVIYWNDTSYRLVEQALDGKERRG